MNEPDVDVVRPDKTRRSDPFSYCSWAAQHWEARFYANTPTHLESRENTIKQLVNNPCWMKCKPRKVDQKAITANNKAKGRKR